MVQTTPKEPPVRHNLAARAGRWSAQHRKQAILGWLAFVIIATIAGGAVGQQQLAREDSGNGGSGRFTPQSDVPADTSDYQMAPAGGSGGSDDDIPF